MAEFEMKCPHCGEALAVQEEWAGMKGECPFCKKSFTITLKPRKLSDPRKKSSDSGDLVYNNSEAANRIDVIAVKNTELSETLNFENVSAEGVEEAKRRSEESGSHVHLGNRKSSAPQADPRKKSSDDNCNLVIDNYESEKRIDVIAAIRELKNTGLSETLDMIDNLPATLLENVSAEQAEEAKRKLEEIGAHVHLESRKSSAPRAEKKKNTAPRPSAKQQIRHNNPKKKARPVQSADSSEQNSKKDDDVGWGTIIFILAAIALVGWLLWLFATGMPRLAFWLIASLFWIIYIPCGGIKMKPLTAILLVVTVIWGWWAHSGTSSSDSGKTPVASAGNSSVSNASEKQTSDSSNSNAESKLVQTISSSNSNYSGEQSSESKIPVNVRVSKKFSTLDSWWKYNCEYKLYADDECVATKNSRSMSVSFKVRVKKGAELRAEMLPKNGFGGTAETHEGPQGFEKKIIASHSGQYITIECW